MSGASSQPAKQARPMIGSTVFKWDDLQVRVTPNGERRDVANNPTPTLPVFECHITTLNPGRASHAPHRHPQEELILVKEGTLDTVPEGYKVVEMKTGLPVLKKTGGETESETAMEAAPEAAGE